MPRKKTVTGRDRLIHVRLSDAIHRQLKVLVAQQGTTLQEWVAEAVTAQLKQSSTHE